MNDHLQPPSDLALEEQTRAGSDAAWDELRARHVGAIEALARTRTPRGATAATDSVFVELRRRIVDPVPPESPGTPDRPTRPRAIALLTGGDYGPAWDPPTPAGADPGPGPGPDAGFGSGSDSDTNSDTGQLVELAIAFGRLPTQWQAVLWHRWVEQAPAAELTAMLGRPAAEIVALEGTARRGLVDAHAEVMLAAGPDAGCAPVIPLLGAYRRGTLPDTQRRAVEAHLGAPVDGCDACHRRLDTIDRLPAIVPIAVAPGLVGVAVDRYRHIIGAGLLAIGAAALATRRSDRSRRRARIGAIAAILLALLGAALFVREPFGDLDSDLADLLEDVTSTTEPSSSPSTTPDGSTPGGTTPDGSTPGSGNLPNRIELVFPGVPQGAVYVPGGRALNLGVSLSTPAAIYVGATGTVDAAITNNDTQEASVRFLLRASPGVAFDRLVGGPGACVAEPEGAGRCTLSLPAGATAEMSLRFTLTGDVADRLVVVSSIGSDVLEVPVEGVPGLLIGQVGRGELLTAGATLGSCRPSPTCPSGDRGASSAALDLPDGTPIDRALLVWEGDRADAPWAGTVGLIPPGSSTAVGISDGEIVTQRDPGATGFRSVADVTDLVRAAGGGTYTVVRPPSFDESGDGSWTLTVITDVDAGPLRLFVVVRPDGAVVPDAPFEVDIPIGGSTPPDTSRRPLTLVLQTATSGSGRSEFTVDGVPVSGGDVVVGVGEAGGAVTYDLDIASTENTLTLVAATSADALRLASIGLAADLVP